MKPNQQLRRAREERGWSQQRVAEAVGTTARTVSRWETGLSRPYPYFREQLCLLFGKSAGDLGLLDEWEAGEEPTSAPQPLTKVEEPEPRREFTKEQPAPALKRKASNDQVLQPAIYDPSIPSPLVESGELVGRTELLKQIKRRLQWGNQVVITALNGLPGVGKTALAIALAADPEIQSRYQDGILWAGLGPQADIQGLLYHWGRLLGMSQQEMERLQELRAWSLALRRAIGQRHMLLIIDDAWKIEDALALQVGGPFCSHLVTTRLTSLAAQVSDDGVIVVPELNEEDSITLFKRFVPEVVQQEPETVRELVRAVGGLPLAQVLMGRYLHAQSINRQPRRVRRALEQLRNSEQRMNLAVPTPTLALPANLACETPWSLQATIAVSDLQLDEQARQALYALSVFPPKPNSFSEEAALAVIQAPVEILDSLSDAGLLESWGVDYYTMHQTIADYARPHLKDQSPSERLIDYYIDYVEKKRNDFPALEREKTNILAALDAATTPGKQEKYLRLFNDFAISFLRVADSKAYRQYVPNAYNIAEESGSVDSLLQVLLHVIMLHDKRGEYEEAEENLQRAFTLVRLHPDHPLLGLLYTVSSRVALSLCDYPRAQEEARKALEHGLQRQDRLVTFLSYTGLGWAAGGLGLGAEQEFFAHKLEQLAEPDHPPELLCFVHMLRAQKALRERNYEVVQEHAQRAFDAANAIAYDEFACRALELLCRSERRQGKYQQAYEHVEQGLILAQRANAHIMIGGMHMERGEILLAQGKLDESRVEFEEARQCTSLRVVRLQAIVLYGLARIEAQKGNIQVAREYASTSLAMLASIRHYEREEVGKFLAKLDTANEEVV